MLRVAESHPHLGPRMESYFDEVTETTPLRCPATNEIVRVTLVKGGSPSTRAFEEVIECPYFEEKIPTCNKECVGQIESK